VVRNAKVTNEVAWLDANKEEEAVIAQANAKLNPDGTFVDELVLCRQRGDFPLTAPTRIDFMDVAPEQLVSIAAALIPFLEHDDANRALMGSNMQRQAVPLLITEPPLVGTGMERVVAQNSSMLVRARAAGVVAEMDSRHIVVRKGDGTDDRYELRKFVGLNERTCLNQRPIVDLGQRVEAGQIMADGAATHQGELALGRNVLVSFMPWDGYNYEDAILVSEGLVKRDVYTSIHIDMFEIEIRETKLGREEFTSDIPNVSERALRNLDTEGIVRVGTRVRAADILVGKVAPKSKSELSPEEKLLHAIFGRAGEDVKNDSLVVPPGTEGIVIETKKFSRKVNITEEERQDNQRRIRESERDFQSIFRTELERLLEGLDSSLGRKLVDAVTRKPFSVNGVEALPELREVRERLAAALRGAGLRRDDPVHALVRERFRAIDDAEAVKNKLVNRLSRGDELPTGVLELVKVYIATRRNLSVGDKMAGRHGNKGVISRILPVEDMPFLEDGTPVDLVLNPLGVPSRMNVGGSPRRTWATRPSCWACASTSVFDGASRGHRHISPGGSASDGRCAYGAHGQAFDQQVTVGYLYMLTPPPGGREDPRACHGALQPHHAAAARRQGALRRTALRRDGGLGARGVRRRPHPAGDADRQVRRRGRSHEDLRVHGQGREHPGGRHAGLLRGPLQRDQGPWAEHRPREEPALSRATRRQPP
jgi:DNA-directed RNA polymerase subunit beta